MKDVRYATFWQRLVALISDVFILVFIELIILLIPRSRDTWLRIFQTSISPAALVIGYFVIMEKIWGATLGKMIWGLRVVGQNQKNLGWFRLTIREGLGKFLSTMIIWEGFLAMWLSDEGVTWHDRLGKTRVITSKKKFHKRNVGWFYGLGVLLIIIQGYTVYKGVLELVNRKNKEMPCNFISITPQVKTNHFDFYFEDPSKAKDYIRETELFETAFDYVFWTISGVKDKVTRTKVCLYSNADSYKMAEVITNVDNTAGFYDPTVSTISMSPNFFHSYDRNYIFDTNGIGVLIYHEIAHYVMDNYLYQNRSRTYLDTWFNEGLAQHFSEECNNYWNKKWIISNKVDWNKMELSYYTEGEKFLRFEYYLQSCLMTEFLIERNGNGLVKKVVEDQVRLGLSTREAVEKESNSNYEKLEEEWKVWLKK